MTDPSTRPAFADAKAQLDFLAKKAAAGAHIFASALSWQDTFDLVQSLGTSAFKIEGVAMKPLACRSRDPGLPPNAILVLGGRNPGQSSEDPAFAVVQDLRAAVEKVGGEVVFDQTQTTFAPARRFTP